MIEIKVFCKLLAYGASDEFEFFLFDVFFNCLFNCLKIKTLMLPEFIVFCYEYSLYQIRRNARKRNPGLFDFYPFALFLPFFLTILHERSLFRIFFFKF